MEFALFNSHSKALDGDCKAQMADNNSKRMLEDALLMNINKCLSLYAYKSKFSDDTVAEKVGLEN